MTRKPLTKKSCLNTLFRAYYNMNTYTDAELCEMEAKLMQWANSCTAKEFIGECESCFGYTYTDENGFARS